MNIEENGDKRNKEVRTILDEKISKAEDNFMVDCVEIKAKIQAFENELQNLKTFLTENGKLKKEITDEVLKIMEIRKKKKSDYLKIEVSNKNQYEEEEDEDEYEDEDDENEEEEDEDEEVEEEEEEEKLEDDEEEQYKDEERKRSINGLIYLEFQAMNLDQKLFEFLEKFPNWVGDRPFIKDIIMSNDGVCLFVCKNY